MQKASPAVRKLEVNEWAWRRRTILVKGRKQSAINLCYILVKYFKNHTKFADIGGLCRCQIVPVQWENLEIHDDGYKLLSY